MCIPILSQLFEELAQQGEVREVVVDGVPVWEFPRDVPANLAAAERRNLDFVKVALRSAVEETQSQDQLLSLVVLAKEQGAGSATKSRPTGGACWAAVDGLERLRLGNRPSWQDRGMGLGYKKPPRRSHQRS